MTNNPTRIFLTPENQKQFEVEADLRLQKFANTWTERDQPEDDKTQFIYPGIIRRFYEFEGCPTVLSGTSAIPKISGAREFEAYTYYDNTTWSVANQEGWNNVEDFDHEFGICKFFINPCCAYKNRYTPLDLMTAIMESSGEQLTIETIQTVFGVRCHLQAIDGTSVLINSQNNSNKNQKTDIEYLAIATYLEIQEARTA